MTVNKNSAKLCVRHIEVAVPLPVYRSFTYDIGEERPLHDLLGKRVLVPFKQRLISGYVIGAGEPTDLPDIKFVTDILDPDPLFPESMIPFFRWIADYYIYPIGETIRCALPAGLDAVDIKGFRITSKGKNALSENHAAEFEKRLLQLIGKGTHQLKTIEAKLGKKIPRTVIDSLTQHGWIEFHRQLKGPLAKSKTIRYVRPGQTIPDHTRLAGAREQIIKTVSDAREISLRALSARVPSAPRLIRELSESGWILIEDRKIYRDPFGEAIIPDTHHILTRDQYRVVSPVCQAFGKGFAPFLLAGVTGSGKTEVYMRLVSESLNRGLPALVLVPEIALISQMERRFRARFGDQIAVLHSGLSPGERYDQWSRIRTHEAMVAIGTRSALFAPFEKLGIIVVDEEHDPSYKQETQLLYNARDMAVVRAMLLDTIVLLGSATPSIQSYYNVKTKKFAGLTLSNRIESRPLPEVTLVDLRKPEAARGKTGFMTPMLIAEIRNALQNHEQILLFLNRRGYANYPVCSSCGKVVTCRNCDISLTYHKGENACICHLCNYRQPFTKSCRSCGAPKVNPLGIGTERVEAAIKSFFPDARVGRMDRDSTRKKGALLTLLKGLRNRSIDILVGTQMLSKGHDFPNITLVGIICADLSLDLPDFRASEKTFQLLSQVSGRAGRGEKPGRVILQTYAPSHFTILSAKDQNFENFFRKEITFRKNLGYPPFSHIAALKISGKNKENARKGAILIGRLSRTLQSENRIYLKELIILGPGEAPLAKIANRYRWQIFLKSHRIKTLRSFISDLLFSNGSIKKFPHLQVAIDVDPYDMM
jgi:primosomal protein N' (replication factor Y)